MKLIVGLGNFEKQYNNTRHNIGFDVLDQLATSTFDTASKLKSLVTTLWLNKNKLLLAKPTTYMNDSGYAVTALLDFYKLTATDLLVVCDDVNLGVGVIRIRPSGGHGGQNGLRHIAEQLGHSNFTRLRCGVGPRPKGNLVNFVLGRFKPAEEELVKQTKEKSVNCIKDWALSGIEIAQNKYNN